MYNLIIIYTSYKEIYSIVGEVNRGIELECLDADFRGKSF